MRGIDNIWNKLVLDREHADGYVRLRLEDVSACAVYAAMALDSGLEALILEVNTDSLPRTGVLPEARGVRLVARAITAGRHGRTRLILQLVDTQYRDVFRALGKDIAERLATCADHHEAASALFDRFVQWQQFLREFGSPGLSREQRLGLFGELVLMRDYLLDKMPAAMALASWKGCYGAHNDFQFRSGAIEVKTSAATSPHGFEVSNVAQLDPVSDANLYVFFVHVIEEESGPTSLCSLIDNIRAELGVVEVQVFEDRLTAAGFLETHRDLYEAPRFSIRRGRFFEVREGFPRLLVAETPDGVEAVHYSVALSACAPFEVQTNDAFAMLASFASRGGADD